MATIARLHTGRREIDVRCSATLPRERTGEDRCQLFAGHDGPHAIMYAHCGERRVRQWRTGDPGRPTDLRTGGLQRPWMFGYPVPAWFESEEFDAASASAAASPGTG